MRTIVNEFSPDSDISSLATSKAPHVMAKKKLNMVKLLCAFNFEKHCTPLTQEQTANWWACIGIQRVYLKGIYKRSGNYIGKKIIVHWRVKDSIVALLASAM